jgi:hypothetical protein
MTKGLAVCCTALAFCLLPSVPRAATPSQNDAALLTVGDLAVRLAGEMALKPSGPDAEAARQALAGAGVQVGGDLQRTLREKDVADILNQLGLHLTTSKPDRPVDGTKVDRLFDLVFQGTGTENKGGVSASDRGNDPPGGGFGRSKSHASPHNG